MKKKVVVVGLVLILVALSAALLLGRLNAYMRKVFQDAGSMNEAGFSAHAATSAARFEEDNATATRAAADLEQFAATQTVMAESAKYADLAARGGCQSRLFGPVDYTSEDSVLESLQKWLGEAIYQVTWEPLWMQPRTAVLRMRGSQRYVFVVYFGDQNRVYDVIRKCVLDGG